jgi:outer membrane lipoprotein carrier protein
MGAGLEERGRFWVERPGKMRWNYLEPERKVAIVAGDRTWLYVEADRQLILSRLGEGSDLISALLAGRRSLAELFAAALVATPRLGGDGSYRLRLEPRSAAEAVEHVVVTARPPEFAIAAAEVLDAAGNRILYRFRRLRRNQGLPPDLFEFVPPAGTDIVGRH